MKHAVYLKETGVAAVLWFAIFAASILLGDTDLRMRQALPTMMPMLSSHPLVAAGSIFANNIVVAGLLAVGAVTGGLMTAAVLALNAVILGIVVSRALLLGLPPETVSLLVLPHGSEIVGFWLAASIGFRGSGIVMAYIRRADLQVAAELPRLSWTFLAATVMIRLER